MDTFAIILSAIAGLLIGGVINALSDDLPPEEIELKLPHYPDGTPREPIAWLGILAFLLGKRTSPTGSKLSWRHPLTEIVTAALFAYVVATYGFSGRSLYFMGNIAILMLITVIDLEHRLILFVVVIPAAVYALIGAAIVGPEISDGIKFTDYLIGGAVGFAIFFLMYMGGVLFNSIMSRQRGEEIEEVAFGYGDVMLATLSGFMLGWQALLFAITIAVFAGGIGALLFLAFRLFVSGEYEMFTALPYGQYIVFGTLVMMLWRAPVVNFLQGGW